MATYTPSTPVNSWAAEADLCLRVGAAMMAAFRDSNVPNYGARLRRARLGLICGIATVSMVFISLTSAYVVRQGLADLRRLDSNTYVRDWGEVQLPWLLLAINTAILLISSLTMEGARRDIARRAALAPVQSIPGSFAGRRKKLSLAGCDGCAWAWDFWWDSGWRGAN